ncbi:terpene synthase family protein [Angustibacter sp. McL0619]|uniref:terpene synthase family protein n=1 Tax=Angustibacter sp. McL0619 TaxID=3415676 RepID=UPI003CF919A3
MMALTGLDTLESARSCLAVDANGHTRHWVRQRGLVSSAQAKRRFDTTRVGDLATRVYASAVSESRLETATDFLSWLFLLDDQLDEGPVGRNPEAVQDHLMHLTRVLSASEPIGQVAPTPLAAALADLWLRVGTAMPVLWRERLIQHVIDYFRGCEWEARNRADCHIPDVDEFVPARREAGAVFPSIDFVEFVADIVVPASVYDTPAFTELRQSAGDVICWTDDVLGVSKERAHGDVHNLVLVLEHAKGLTPEAAVAEAVVSIRTRIADFERHAESLPQLLTDLGADTQTRDATAQYVKGLKDWMRGFADWALETVRYLDVDNDAVKTSDAYLEPLLGQ